MGIAEAGVLPGCFYLIGMWYKRLEAQKRFTFFFNASSIAAAFGGLLASGIGKKDRIRGYSAWRWIFILEGILTCVFSVTAFYIIPDFPENAKWMTKAERAYLVERLAADQRSSEIEKDFTLQVIMKCFKD
ncbi:hypothetical protein MMC07_003239 [Pseudocyphellaria aurata]|nr:hypothetical protein [Pseudocyphellaria aurata]